MGKFIIRRLLVAILIIVAILLMNFFILRLTPGDPLTTSEYQARSANNGRPLTPAQEAALAVLKKRIGVYVDPWPEALAGWLGGLVRFDFGLQLNSGQPVGPLVVQAALGSLWLLLMSLVLGAGLGIPLGIYAAYRRGSWKDKVVQFISIAFNTLPGWFFLILFTYLNQQLWLLSGKNFSLRPIFGYFGPVSDNFALLPVQFWSIFLPVLFLAATFLALFCTQARSQTLEVLDEDYVRTARAKGLPARRVLVWHVFRNSLPPLVSILGGIIPFVFGAQILVEREGRWGGLGNLFLSSAGSRDYSTLMAIFTILAVVCVLCSFLADVTYGLIDPRVREAMR